MFVSRLILSTSPLPFFSWSFPVSVYTQTFKICLGTSSPISGIAYTHLHYIDFTNGESEPAITHLDTLCFGFCYPLQFPEFSEATELISF